MREFDEYGLKICKFQGELFMKSVEMEVASSLVFLRRFMYSDVASRMDGEGFLYEAINIEDVFYEITKQFGTTDYGKVKFSAEELYWIGYIYRYWCYTQGISSKKLYKMIKPRELRDLYYPYHSLDPANAISRIKESKGLNEDDYIQRGVEIYRKLKEAEVKYTVNKTN